MNINSDLLQWFRNFFDKKYTLLGDKPASGDAIKFEFMPNQELAE